MKKHRITLSLLLLLNPAAFAHEAGSIETVRVEGRRINLLGKAGSASEGIIGQKEISLRPLLRTGEVLEFIPGMIVTQHSGTGKANQYFLRGFNLDHGTDFSTVVDGMPVNMRTHGHGQGYTDLNFLIPETVSQLSYKKGAYYADVGDFSGAGGVHIETLQTVENGTVELNAGNDNYYRLLVMDSIELANGKTLFAFEGNRYDGPWSDIQEDLNKKNLMLKHTRALNDGSLSIMMMSYNNQWNSADQIPSRAVTQGIIDELGSIDDTTGGEASRESLSAHWTHEHWQGAAYLIHSELNLWSNFTYFLNDETNGDQFEQVDKRTLYGGQIHYLTDNKTLARNIRHRFGLEFRIDDIDEVGLYRTQARRRIGAIRNDEVKESSIGLFWENRIAWNDHLRSVLGVRFDYYDFKTRDTTGTNVNGVNVSPNNGNNEESIPSLKGSLIYTFDNEWEGYISAGQGFHSNDARGTTHQIDPSDGTTIAAVDPLVRSLGYEIGARGFINDHINTSFALWALTLDSELLFVGDAGNTEPSRASRRKGAEFTAYYYFNTHWNIDVEYAYTDAKFSQSAPEGNKIPGAIQNVLQTGINANLNNGWFGSLRLRYFGERPLTENGSVKSDPSTIWNFRAGYQRGDWTLKTDILNLTDSDDHDIDYYYASRLFTDAAGVETEDVHYHVFEPRTIRLSASYRF